MSKENVIKYGFGISGEKRAILRDLNGRVVYDSGWSPNLITDLGMQSIIGQNVTAWANYWCVGSDGTAVSTSDTSMGANLKWMNQTTGVSRVRTNSGASNYILTDTDSKRWEAGTGGTVREFGLCGDLNGNNTYVHTNVTPEVVKGTDQILDFFYRMTMTPNTLDQTGSIVIGANTYDYIVRPMKLATSAFPNNFVIIGGSMKEASTWQIYDGDISADIGNSTPSGTAQTLTPAGTKISASYVGADTAEYRWTREIGVDSGNFASPGIRSFRQSLAWASSESLGIQVQLSNQAAPLEGLIKTSNDKVEIDFLFTLTRT